jgi:DNA polymerase-3 subunit epsilon
MSNANKAWSANHEIGIYYRRHCKYPINSDVLRTSQSKREYSHPGAILMEKWDLDRPLAFFDIEATGISPRTDRIIELAIIKLLPPDGERIQKVYRINPEMPIPPEATDIHGISDDDVKDCPTFDQLAKDILDMLEGCDLAGYNIIRFDIPMLTEEFMRAKIRFDASTRRIIDAQRIFHKKEPRDLAAALMYYCHEEHQDAHGALADTDATLRVLEGQLKMYDDLPHDMASLSEYCNPKDPSWVDQAGRLKWEGSEVVLNFSKKKGMSLRNLAQEDPGFLRWMIRSDFPMDTREIVKNALDGIFPEKR